MPKFTLAQLQATGLELEVQGPASSIRIPGAKRGRPEDEFKHEVMQFAQNHGWLRAHFRPAKTDKGWRTPVEGDGKGFLDLVLVRERVVWAETKADGNTLTDDQEKWFKALKFAKQEVYVWWPKDWPEIRRVLG